jgi:hypothetical protein
MLSSIVVAINDAGTACALKTRGQRNRHIMEDGKSAALLQCN